ncbi:hypothetical protein, partial [Microbacterium sp. B35-30]|uniref:hypothetical protein n=1 Tax=Microbacterium sp. B35-30 TaxID=1962642 RepID=UPI0013D0522F
RARDPSGGHLFGVIALEQIPHRGTVGLGHPALLLALASEFRLGETKMLEDPGDIRSFALRWFGSLGLDHHDFAPLCVRRRDAGAGVLLDHEIQMNETPDGESLITE